MPRIPRVTPAEPTVHERIMASLAGSGAEPAIVEPIDGEAAEPSVDGEGVRVGDPVPSPSVVEPTNADVRAWAADNYDGEVSASGPIPKLVREAYDAAHGSPDA